MLKINFLNNIFFGKPIQVSEYNKGIMDKPTFKTTIPDDYPSSFYDWAERMHASSSCPKTENLDWSIDKNIN